MTALWKTMLKSYDDRRDIIIPGNSEKTLQFCAEHFIDLANEAIRTKQRFAVALSGGSTPKAIFQLLASPKFANQVDWTKVLLFWSDERCVPPTDPESNYLMAMQAGFSTLPIPQQNIFRMVGEAEDLEASALDYEKAILKHVPKGAFDLVMLGMGEDGHTASLFPETHGLNANEDRLAIANFVPQKDTWRMSLTYSCINASKHIAIYVLGKSKASTVEKIFTSPYDPDELPIQRIGTRTHKALWILDEAAAQALVSSL